MLHSVQFSRSVVSDSLWPHESQHARPPCTSPTPRVYSNSCPLSRWCYPAISSCHPLLLPPIPPSIRVLSNESTLHIRWPKYWSFSISISPSNEHPGLISPRMDWLDLLAVQGTLKSLLQHHSSKASILPRSAFFTVQLSLHIINFCQGFHVFLIFSVYFLKYRFDFFFKLKYSWHDIFVSGVQHSN